MKIKYGTTVIDKNNKVIGTVDHLMSNPMTGETSKFVVNRQSPEPDLFLSPQDVMEITDTGIKLKLDLDEIKKD